MISTSRWRTLELRLMYHYTAVVSHTIPGCNGAPTEAWQRTIPQLSFESEVVLNPMLALSALHLHAHSHNDSNMAIALRRYLDQSLVNHRQALSNPGEELSEQLWLSAVLLSHIYWLLAHQAQPNEAYELPLQAFKMLEGVGVLFEQKNVFLGRQGYMWIGYEAMPHIAPEAKLSIAAQIQLRSIEEDLTYLLDAFDVPALPDNDKSIYIEAKNYVLHHYRAFFSGADPKTFQRFIAFIVVRCQPGYRNKLEQYDPLAMALMARMLVLQSGLGHAWWMNGRGDYEVIERDVRGIRELIPANLRWVMDWPCKVLDREIILTRD
ncbi:hypothetical protein G7Y89_g11931 [Cudoniella acicularis]|uniref:Uncharacterized protein n=1 Tax=Cudoniella acicularis TaxID=354080 RepID=A0A8H4RB19_9HELO|nr:hypothetical protein G7Y89_g11931 [Cudoniella acicularis]